jgi:trk system potassium uptake protein TrkA
VGGGQAGYHFAQGLAQDRREVVAIHLDPEALRRVSDQLDVQTLQGSGSNPRVLAESGLKDADIIFAATHKDEVNLAACLSPTLSPPIQKVALIRNPDYPDCREALTHAILNHGPVITPVMEVVSSMLCILRAPEAEEVNDWVGGRPR